MNGSAVVVGGGIGGLAAAVALRRTGWDVTVLERASEFREVGAGLSLSPNAIRALEALGLGDRAAAAGVPTWATHTMRVPSGRYLMRAPAAGDPPLRAFRRAALHRVLYDAVPAEHVHTGCAVSAVEPSRGSVRVTHESGALTADLVVAADGIHSATRRALWPDAAPPRYLGHAAWLGLADCDEPVGPGGAAGLQGSMTLGRGQAFLIHPVGPRQVYWALLAVADRPGVRHPDELAEVLRRIGSWHDPVPALLEATPGDAIRHIDIHDLPALPTFVHGRVALLGDAAHAMSPDRGQGAGQSIEDAVVLAVCLAATADVPTALSRYDEQRRPRTQSTADNARQAARSTIGAGPVAHRLTTAALGLVPSRLWARIAPRALGPLWDWVPPPLVPTGPESASR